MLTRRARRHSLRRRSGRLRPPSPQLRCLQQHDGRRPARSCLAGDAQVPRPEPPASSARSHPRPNQWPAATSAQTTAQPGALPVPSNTLLGRPALSIRQSHSRPHGLATSCPSAAASPAFNLRSIGQTLLQPRLAMTAAMAFFSIALTLNLTGVRFSELRASDLRPSSLKRSFYEANAHVVRYYDNLRVVYELESRVHDLQRASDSDSDSVTPAPATASPSDSPQSPRRSPLATSQPRNPISRTNSNRSSPAHGLLPVPAGVRALSATCVRSSPMTTRNLFSLLHRISRSPLQPYYPASSLAHLLPCTGRKTGMNCANHPDRERVAFCQNCGKPLCQECTRTVGSAVYLRAMPRRQARRRANHSPRRLSPRQRIRHRKPGRGRRHPAARTRRPQPRPRHSSWLHPRRRSHVQRPVRQGNRPPRRLRHPRQPGQRRQRHLRPLHRRLGHLSGHRRQPHRPRPSRRHTAAQSLRPQRSRRAARLRQVLARSSPLRATYGRSQRALTTGRHLRSALRHTHLRPPTGARQPKATTTLCLQCLPSHRYRHTAHPIRTETPISPLSSRRTVCPPEQSG